VLPCRFGDAASAAACPVIWYERRHYESRRGGGEMFLQRAPGGEQPLGDQLLLPVKALRGHRHRDGDVVAEEIASAHAGRDNCERMLLEIEGNARLARRLELLERLVETRDRARRAPLEAGADQAGDGDLVEARQIGLTVGGAVEREGFADRRHRAQA